MAIVLLTRQKQTVEYRARYVRPPQTPVPPSAPATWSHSLPAGGSVTVLPGGLSAEIVAGDTVGVGQVRAVAPVNNVAVEAVLDVEIVGGAVAAELVAIGAPVDV